MVERLLKRAEMSGRVDDNEETIKNRLEVFEKEITPIIEFYKEKGNFSEVSKQNDVYFSSTHYEYGRPVNLRRYFKLECAFFVAIEITSK